MAEPEPTKRERNFRVGPSCLDHHEKNLFFLLFSELRIIVFVNV